MKRIFSRINIALPIWVMLGSNVAAMCIWFVPPTRQFAPATNMKSLIVREENRTRMIVQPEFSGDATDFALVMPFPSQPELAEAPEKLFEELEDLTNPLIDFNDQPFEPCEVCATVESAGEDGVRIIEERDVGDYSSVTLEATSADGLSEWLEENGYEITDEKLEIISQYVSDNGYFVALKVNVKQANVDELGILQGKLNPIEFSFDSKSIMLPLRLMSGDGSLVTLTVYTVADDLTYIPGAEIQFSKKITSTDIKETPSIEPFNAWRKWLVRNVVQLDTNDISADLELLTTKDTFIVVPEEQSIILDPDKLPAETGVIVSEDGEIKYSEELSGAATNDEEAQKTNPITWTMVVALSISNVILLILLINKAEQAKRNSK